MAKFDAVLTFAPALQTIPASFAAAPFVLHIYRRVGAVLCSLCTWRRFTWSWFCCTCSILPGNVCVGHTVLLLERKHDDLLAKDSRFSTWIPLWTQAEVLECFVTIILVARCGWGIIGTQSSSGVGVSISGSLRTCVKRWVMSTALSSTSWSRNVGEINWLWN